jgi:mannose-6-phosphate isomerase-like protein (cupin superfamily)
VQSPSTAGAPAAGTPAPTPPAGAPGAQAQGQGGRGGNAGPTEGRANEVSGISIDRFIASPISSPAHFSHGGLFTRAILRPGDPYKPGDLSAVLEYRKLLALATLPVRSSTPLMALPDQYLFFVTSGQGRLEDGKQFWDLRQNVAVLIPPNAQRRFVNTSEAPLTMVMLQWEPSAPPRADILVRDVDKLGWCEENAHWNNMSKCIFRSSDGLLGNERMLFVVLQPWTMAAPHTHGPGTEEVWVKVTPGTAVVTLGSELREMPQYSAFLVPPTGFTTHGQINLSKENAEAWLYIARGPGGTAPRAGEPGAAGAPAPGRGGRGNPNLFTDQATIDQATVRGQPIR